MHLGLRGGEGNIILIRELEKGGEQLTNDNSWAGRSASKLSIEIRFDTQGREEEKSRKPDRAFRCFKSRNQPICDFYLAQTRRSVDFVDR